MTNVNVRALAQQETVMEKEYREVFYKEGEYRFTVEMCTPNKNKQYHNLHSVSRQRAQQEAVLIIDEIMQQHNYERLAWRMVSVEDKTNWSMATSSIAVPPVVKKKKEESIFTRLLDYFFFDEDDYEGK